MWTTSICCKWHTSLPSSGGGTFWGVGSELIFQVWRLRRHLTRRGKRLKSFSWDTLTTERLKKLKFMEFKVEVRDDDDDEEQKASKDERKMEEKKKLE